MVKQVFDILFVFLAGVVAFINLAQIRYGVPDHFHWSWFNVFVACFFAIAFGATAINNQKGE